jgi:hypothetical protein
MQTKSFIAILLCVVILVTGVYTAYQYGSSTGYKNGVQHNKLVDSDASSRVYQSGYDIGYQAGLKAQNQTTP